jgi:DNA-binding CsgD family transcriptional regulator
MSNPADGPAFRLVELGLEALHRSAPAPSPFKALRTRRVLAERRMLDTQECHVEIHEVSSVAGANYVVVVQPVRCVPDEGALRRCFHLTRQQSRIALLLLELRSDRAIAKTLGIAYETARNHVKTIRLKMNAKDRREIPGIVEAALRPL